MAEMWRLHVSSPCALLYVFYLHQTTKSKKKGGKKIRIDCIMSYTSPLHHILRRLCLRCMLGIYRSIMNTDGRLMRCAVIISNKKLVNGSINPMTRTGEGCEGDDCGRGSLARNLLKERRRINNPKHLSKALCGFLVEDECQVNNAWHFFIKLQYCR